MFEHKSVMLNEVIDNLNIQPNGVYVDCTAGGGGHSLKILQNLTGGKLIAIDKDIDAINECKNKFADYKNVILIHDDFHNIKSILEELNIDKVDGIIVDLGVSSFQIDTADRGFSYRFDAPLDMRMNQEQVLTAYDVVNNYSEDDLANIMFKYGEEKFSRQIARKIVEYRQTKNIETTLELVNVVESVLPAKVKFEKGHSCKRVFQAIRIEVNGEIEGLKQTIIDMVEVLKSKGRLCVLTFHSLEDRIVKDTFKELATDCICPKELPVCICNHHRSIDIVNKKPIIASSDELNSNSRSASAKLRVAQKV